MNPQQLTALTLQLRSGLQQAQQQLAKNCQVDGKLDSVRLDAEQIPCFELAWAAAELLAAERANEAIAAASDVDQKLLTIFVCEALLSIRERLANLFAALALDCNELSSVDLNDCRRHLTDGGGALALTQQMHRNPQALGEVELDEDHAMIRDQFRRFAREVVAPQAEAIHRDNLSVPESLLQPLREFGVFGLAIPQRYGGIAPDDRDDSLGMIAVTEALSEASLAAAGSLITRPEILARALLAGGTEAQKSYWLPLLAAGDPLCAIAITEPDFGSDVAGLKLRAKPCDGGWKLSGAKTWCTFAGKAGVIMVVARTNDRPGHRGLSLLLAEKPVFDGESFEYVQPEGGKLIGRAIATIGYRGMHSFDLSFDDFFVPAENLIGEAGGEGRGFYYTMAGMTGGRMQTAARACGVMRAALMAAISYASERKVFGAALGDYALTAGKLTRMAARYAASRQLTYHVGNLLDGGAGRMEASLVKLFACRSAELLTREALQIHGGMGYAEECSVSRYFVDARVLSIFEGAEETLALKVIARSLLEDVL